MTGPARAAAGRPGPQAGADIAGGSTGQELLAAAYLSRVAEPAAIPLWLLVQEYGYLDAAAAVRAGDVPPEVASCTEARRLTADPYADLAAAEHNDIRLITPASPEWPHYAFAPMHRLAHRRTAEWLTGRRARAPRGELIPPLALWVRGVGRLAEVGVRSAALVGSRAASPYGERLAADFGYGLARQDVVVVSGGAYGIDAAVHRGALAADGESVLVSAGGLDRPYPPAHRMLYDRTAEVGMLVSERPPGSAPHRQRFLSRNRIIAALGSVTVVIEAGQRSGALNTAGYARDLGRPVLAVPGPVTSAMSVGCHRLLQRDDRPAHLVTSVADILGFCSLTGGPVGAVSGVETDGEPADPAARSPLAPGGNEVSGGTPRDSNAVETRRLSADALQPTERAVLDGLPARGPVTEAELARLSGQPIAAVLAALPALLAHGLVTSSREGYRLRRH